MALFNTSINSKNSSIDKHIWSLIEGLDLPLPVSVSLSHSVSLSISIQIEGLGYQCAHTNTKIVSQTTELKTKTTTN